MLFYKAILFLDSHISRKECKLELVAYLDQNGLEKKQSHILM